MTRSPLSRLAAHVPGRRPERDLAGLVVLVTGGARGIGAATAARLSAAGARVAIGDRDADLASETASELDAAARRAGRGGQVVAAPLDVTDEASWAAFTDAVAHLGPVDVLVNNAGVMPLGPALEEADAVSRTILDVNVLGVVLGTKAVGPAMVARGRGQLVNVASAVGRIAAPGGATYSASKFAVVGYSEALRGELRPHGVDVSLVLPTVVLTELSAGVEAAKGIEPVTADDVAEVVESTIRRPQPELWVPRWTRHLTRTTQALPRPVQDAMARAFGTDHVLADADPAARAAYEARARGSRPAAVPGEVSGGEASEETSEEASARVG
ncbi:SDR family oxidoreductase [Nocardioides perillae]|uniref:Short-chain dehydrogenase n=1 Tax=Nocardioides perillae TaxID=1119534 RepID=A0A7Y9RSP7_9ACTN|nr:SDR family oxidoreductase [Nocardioides perillae]NYG54556.1 hypothetical protein [Nocardioides perillae]